MKSIRLVFALATLLPLAGCNNLGGASLVFGQEQVVGVTIAGSAPSQQAEFTVGYKDKNIAVVPVAIKNDDGTYEHIKGSLGKGEHGGDTVDSYSTFGQFELNVSAKDEEGNPVASTGLGKFFATGNAANVISQGFQNKLNYPNGAPAPSPKPAEDNE